MSVKKSKTELVSEVASKSGLTKADAAKAVDALFEVVTETLVAKGEVAVLGFGKFSTVSKPERDGRNPSTGAAMKVAATTAAKFSVGKALKDAVHKG